MISVAILALAVIPMLLTREHCFDNAYDTKVSFTIQELAKRKLADISLNVTHGRGNGEFEQARGYTFEYEVTLFDFRTGLEEDEEDRDSEYFDTTRSDAVYADDESDLIDSLTARHVVLRVFAPPKTDDEDGFEYVIDTYIPVLMTREQFEKLQDSENNENS